MAIIIIANTILIIFFNVSGDIVIALSMNPPYKKGFLDVLKKTNCMVYYIDYQNK